MRDYNAFMSIRTADYIDAIEHLPDGATLVMRQFSWDDYERLLEELRNRPHLRVSYDSGNLEIMSPLPEHEKYAAFIDDLVRFVSEALDQNLEKLGRTTWKKRSVAKGVEPDTCFYVKNAVHIIGKRKIDLESDPPPDIAVEIDITNESSSKFPIYAALSVPEIWRYDGQKMQFFRLVRGAYREISESRFLAGLTPAMLAGALEQATTEGQTAALTAFRKQWRQIKSNPIGNQS